jgi:NADH-quinone oxidoreductase subunit M
VVQKTCYGPPVERFAHLPDLTLGLGVPRMILASVIVIFGLFPSWLFDMINTATAELLK